MIKISLDEGYCFDILAIINNKILNSHGENKDKLIKSYELLASEIKDQIGQNIYEKIVCSDEYIELFNINKRVFELVDLAKNDKILASEVDKANYSRFVFKTRLQKKFFNNDIKEVKINYE